MCMLPVFMGVVAVLWCLLFSGSLGAGCGVWVSGVGCGLWVLGVGCGLFDVGCGCQVLGVGCWV